jgi:hypothetical protein
MAIEDLSPVELELLKQALVRQERASAISAQFEVPVSELRVFVEGNRAELTKLREEASKSDTADDGEPTPTELDQLWLSRKFERLMRYQEVADMLYDDMTGNRRGIKSYPLGGSDLSTAAREFRSYCQLAANELGQLMHRGAGDVAEGDTMSIDIGGIDINTLR